MGIFFKRGNFLQISTVNILNKSGEKFNKNGTKLNNLNKINNIGTSFLNRGHSLKKVADIL